MEALLRGFSVRRPVDPTTWRRWAAGSAPRLGLQHDAVRPVHRIDPRVHRALDAVTPLISDEDLVWLRRAAQ
ncbi:hypothetical protein QJS66_15630 [Kocuria rhizophila]|nr:hypothetical protein QJS66_15630 [Kocuria rhizophila]